jgi:tetratricopeptide (TPR) repeat protein
MEPGPLNSSEATGAEDLAAKTEEALGRWGSGDYREAETLILEVVDGYRNALGDAHPSTLSSMNSLASVLYWQGRYTEAETILRHTLESSSNVLGEEDPSTLATKNELGLVMNRLGRYPEVLGKEHSRALSSMVRSALALSAEEKYSEAEDILRQTLDIYVTIRGMDHPKTLDCMRNLSSVLGYQGKFLEAEKMDRLIAGNEAEAPERYSSVCYLGEVSGKRIDTVDHAIVAGND